MTIKITLFVIILTLLTSCSKLGMLKTGASYQDLAEISYGCKKDSTFRTSNANINAHTATANSSMAVNDDLYRSCLRANGVKLFNCPANATEVNAANGCTPTY